jgi:site-specific DNA-methyltransferase (adenine-specific)/modification methylase
VSLDLSLRWQVIEGDCLDVMRTLPDGCVGAVVTDPPYGIGVTRMTLGNRKGAPVNRASAWDDSAPSLAPLLALGVPAVVWGGNHFELPVSRCWFVWDKGTGDNSFADAELAWTNLDGAVRMFRRSWVGQNARERGAGDREHPTQKPVSLMAWCIQRLNLAPDSLILDPFSGSGSTGVAAIQEGHRFLGIEREPAYVAIARRRIADAAAQGSLFEAAS